MPSDLIREWRPVRVKKTRQIKNLEPRFDSIETEKALAARFFRQCVGKAPGMAIRVDDAGIARAPERIPWRHRDGRAGFRRALHRRVAVLDFEMHRDRGSLDLVGRKYRVHHAMRAAMLGKIIHHENPRAI